MSSLIEIIRRIVQQELARGRSPALGVVTAVLPHTDADDDRNYAANVRLKHEDLELRQVPIAVGHVAFVAPPRVGDLVLVEFVGRDLNQPLITGRFYHADERPPLHREDEVLFEQRVPDDTLNHLRFTDDGTIYLQRDVTAPEDNSQAKTGLKIDGASGDLEIVIAKSDDHSQPLTRVAIKGDTGDLTIQAGDKMTVTLTAGQSLEVKAGEITVTVKQDDSVVVMADGKPMTFKCSKLTVKGDVDVNGTLKVSGGGHSTTISGNEITGA